MTDLSKVILSITIPTYNGGPFIRDTLDSIIKQIAPEIWSKVEVVISDNASEDNTEEISKEYSGNYEYIKYFKNDKNLGAPENSYSAVMRSTGIFVWLFSDDDIIQDGSIKKVLNVIENNPVFSVIFVNYGIYNADFTYCYNEAVIPLEEDTAFFSCNDFIQITDVACSFISGTILNRSYYLKSFSQKFKNSPWIQFAALLQLLPLAPSFIIAHPYVKYRGDVCRWEKKGSLLQFSYIELPLLLIEATKGKYHNSTIEAILTNRKKNLTKIIISSKTQGYKIPIKGLITIYAKYFHFWIIDIPLILLPAIVYRSKKIRRMYKKLKEHYPTI